MILVYILAIVVHRIDVTLFREQEKLTAGDCKIFLKIET
jgi:hypothetical protein